MASPTDRRYSDKHVWAKKDGNVVAFGLTQYYITKFGPVSSMSNLAALNTGLNHGDKMGVINRSGGQDDFIAPLGGGVIDREEHNFDIGEVNSDPYNDTSRFIKVDGAKQEEYDALMTAAQYDAFTQ